jgi:hypothetical protein
VSAAGPRLRAISPEATPEEVAAIVAAVELCTSSVSATSDDDGDDAVHEWVRGARLGARRAGVQRGPWRLSARMARRSRT